MDSPTGKKRERKEKNLMGDPTQGEKRKGGGGQGGGVTRLGIKWEKRRCFLV